MKERCALILFICFSALCNYGWTQQSEAAMEEIVVIGTHIRGSSTEAPVPVSVIGRREIESLGAPTVTDLANDLPWASGNENRSNALGAQNGNTGTAKVNLRGLGLGTTLVLFNGKRMAHQATSSTDGSAFVDINYMPSIMLQRVEILKDGAAALYGSDAVAGVINFVPREDFVGSEIQVNYRARTSSASAEDWDVSGIWGVETASGNFVIAAAYSEVAKMRGDEVDFTMEQHEANRTVSTLAGPGSFIPTPVIPDQLAAFQNLPNVIGAPFISGMPINDPDCEAIGGIKFNVAGRTGDLGLPAAYGRCGYSFRKHYNLADDQEKINIYSTFKHLISDELELYAEFGYYRNDVDKIGNSPSFPVLKFVTIPGDHPANIYQMDGIFLGRPFGQNFPSKWGYREYQTYRLVTGLKGDLTEHWEYDGSISYSNVNVEDTAPTVYQQRFDDAMHGLGGPNCDTVNGTAGVGNCMWFNPFGTRFTTMPNSTEVEDYMRGVNYIDSTSGLLVVDAVFTGDLWDLKSGSVLGAFGFQYRDASLDLNRNADSIVPGTYIFVGGGNEFDENQDVYALFAELAVPLADNLDLQLAARYEDYGGDTGDTFDPKIAALWAINDMFTLRASASTTFRAPTLNQQYSTGTSLVSLVDGPTTGFKGVDAAGNPLLKPENATTFNIGILFNPTQNITGSLDYWRFEFEDIIGVESGQTKVSIENLLCPLRTADCRDPDIIRNPLTGEDPDDNLAHSGEIVRVISSYVNAPGVDTDGLDLDIKWNLSTQSAGDFMVGLQGMYMFDYTINGIPGIQNGQVGNVTIEAAGNRNDQNFARPLPEWKANFTVRWFMGGHSASAIVRHVTDYNDDKTVNQEFNKTIDSMTTFDLHYTYSFNQDKTRVSLAIINATDEDPPFADQDFNFDARTHNPFGRMFQLVMRHQFGM